MIVEVWSIPQSAHHGRMFINRMGSHRWLYSSFISLWKKIPERFLPQKRFQTSFFLWKKIPETPPRKRIPNLIFSSGKDSREIPPPKKNPNLIFVPVVLQCADELGVLDNWHPGTCHSLFERLWSSGLRFRALFGVLSVSSKVCDSLILWCLFCRGFRQIMTEHWSSCSESTVKELVTMKSVSIP